MMAISMWLYTKENIGPIGVNKIKAPAARLTLTAIAGFRKAARGRSHLYLAQGEPARVFRAGRRPTGRREEEQPGERLPGPLSWPLFFENVGSRLWIMPAACDSFVEDIEDIVSAQDPKPHDQQFTKRSIVPHIRKRKKNQQDEGTDDVQADSVIPGAQKIWVKTWGCSHNSSDGEYMAGQLAVYGYKITALFIDYNMEADPVCKVLVTGVHRDYYPDH
ncbi:hypothetical protein chiPu_0013137 [Chiloscyllium punctatum]|uniref:MTTase N-terminal domain-containing protein n=1 Tax=Chiloscyllium punctatum TaxID=137246 RepID=A0A401SW82_CHIPU|nr:hypothetical protein [Chiloscyllium punctatum]